MINTFDDDENRIFILCCRRLIIYIFTVEQISHVTNCNKADISLKQDYTRNRRMSMIASPKETTVQVSLVSISSTAISMC